MTLRALATGASAFWSTAHTGGTGISVSSPLSPRRERESVHTGTLPDAHTLTAHTVTDTSRSTGSFSVFVLEDGREIISPTKEHHTLHAIRRSIRLFLDAQHLTINALMASAYGFI